jgi:uncharacterized protein
MDYLILKNETQNSTLSNKVENAVSFYQRSKGLLGRSSLDLDHCLWIQNCKSVHTCFMKFSIDVLYVDKNLKVTKIDRNLKPWSLSWGGLSSESCFEFQSERLTSKIAIGDQLRVSS